MPNATAPRRFPLKSSDMVPIRVRTSQVGRVLLVEDNDDLRHAMAEQLRERGWDVFSARDVHTALELAVKCQPRAIVSELVLPDVRGHFFARSFRTIVDNDVRLIGVTRLPEQIFDQARTAGFDEVHGKPIDIDTLHDLLVRN